MWMSADVTPLDVLTRWPARRPLMMLHSAGGPSGPARWSRWSILASPRAVYRFDGRSSLSGDVPEALSRLKFTHDPLRDLDAVLAATATRQADDRADREASSRSEPLFRCGWIGYLSYDLGGWIEPAVGSTTEEERSPWPLIELAYCPDGLVHDNVTGQWRVIGDEDGLIAEAVACGGASPRRSRGLMGAFVTGDVRARSSPDEYMSKVARAIEYIGAGDIYQANIAQWFESSFEGSTRALARAALESSRAWYGACLELESGRGIVSMSPELFLEFDAQRRLLTTRPIKGTAPGSADPERLRDSAKDAAELHMIVDLMRNDLGRVCEIGSVRVVDARSIETHESVHHGVAEIVGRPREGVTMGEILRATFPGGSVTGAPKIRAMQIIEELEGAGREHIRGRGRGPYCGSIGYISDCGNACFGMAIRTILLRGRQEPGRFDRLTGTLEYAAGCGIVADSDPAAEYRESLDKTVALRHVLTPQAGGVLSGGASQHLAPV